MFCLENFTTGVYPQFDERLFYSQERNRYLFADKGGLAKWELTLKAIRTMRAKTLF